MDPRELKEILDADAKLSMAPHEKNAMREDLKLFMSEHPARLRAARGQAHAPLLVRAFARLESAFVHVRFTHMQPTLAALVLVLCVGVGTSYAAEGALPGDPLYGIKININESVHGALAISNTAKAQWNAARAARRLEEAESLAAVGKLTSDVSSEIKTHLEQSTKEFDQSVSAIAETVNGAPEVAEVQSDFEATLTAHAQVLADISDTLPNVRAQIAPILASVAARAGGAAQAREQAERVVAAKNTEQVRIAAVDKKIAAVSKLHEMRATARDRRNQPTGDSAPRAVMAMKVLSPSDDTEESDTEQTIAQGDQSFDRREYGKAFVSFQAAIRTANTAKVKKLVHERLKGTLDLSHASLRGATGDATTLSTTGVSVITGTSTSTEATTTIEGQIGSTPRKDE